MPFLPVSGGRRCRFSQPWGFSCNDPQGQLKCQTSLHHPHRIYRPAAHMQKKLFTSSSKSLNCAQLDHWTHGMEPVPSPGIGSSRVWPSSCGPDSRASPHWWEQTEQSPRVYFGFLAPESSRLCLYPSAVFLHLAQTDARGTTWRRD